MVAVQGFEPWTHKGTAPDVRRARRNYAAGAVRNRLKGAGEGEREAQETGGILLLQA